MKFTKFSIITAGVFAATLALTGCGGADSTPAASGKAVAATPEAAATTQAAEPATKSFTSPELETLVGKLKDATGKPMTVITAADIDAGMKAQNSVKSSMKIEPVECKALLENSDPPAGAKYAGAASAKGSTSTIVTVISADTSVVKEKVQLSIDAVSTCPKFTVDVLGQTITTVVTSVKVPEIGELNSGMYITQTLPDGAITHTLSVSVMQDGLIVAAVNAGADVTTADLDAVSKLAEDTLALAKG